MEEKYIKASGAMDVPGCRCVKHAKVFGFDDSVRRAKFPMSVDVEKLNAEVTPGIKKLAESERGAGHDQWLTGVIVQFDLTFSNKAWVEMERYHFVDFVSSQSTMHRIAKFDLDVAYNKYVDKRVVEVMKEKALAYNTFSAQLSSELEPSAEDQEKLKEMYLEVLYSNPAGFEITAGLTTNYRQFKTIYAQRRTHRLPEWREFCAWIETLPYSELITGGKNGN